ncbi:sarcosine oxidase [Deinobacterium chartae]|uniref:Sarcosine oxidase n=1 Tax=Deinobacterium chartae TaxID=521158 RepID=A0A841I144_9DEIO|nr:N-methyl-L-tryptophan oxidase [Deinobacterium chartae]MBB6098129.1 sarcosine oxidase [Deinobacterium chartae]
MHTRAHEYIVIGAGGTGAATAYELARTGHDVLLLEQFTIGHDRGSSFGPSRIFRFAYEEPDYARLAASALEAWRDLEADAGARLLWQTGGLDLGPHGVRSLQRTADTLAEIGHAGTWLDANELQRRYPQWRVPDDWAALYSEHAGIVNPSLTVELLAAMTRVHGGTVLERTPVVRLELGPTPVVHTERGRFAARRVVVAAGGWLPTLFPQLGKALRVSLEATMFFRPRNLADFAPERFPIFIAHDRSQAYGFPAFGLPGVKIALHGSGPAVDADARPLDVAPDMIERARAFLERHLPAAAGPLMEARTCLYTNAPAEDFVLLPHPRSEAVLIASPCSGHGFKFVPLTGRIVAAAARGEAHPGWLDRFRSPEVQAALNG